MHVIVVGGGVAGLGSAMVLARQGHEVTVVERDPTPMPASADEAFEWDRRGAPQVRHSHAFLARLVGLLKKDYADVYAALLREGATEMRFGDDLPPTITNYERQPDDDELAMLACRRTTFEWVLRRTAMEDTELGGQQIKKGDKVVLHYHAANHDEATFGEDAMQFDIRRAERMPDLYNQLRSFGIGQHFCIGSHLARLELNIMFEELIPRLRNPRLQGEPRFVRSFFVNAMKELRITFDPESASVA